MILKNDYAVIPTYIKLIDWIVFYVLSAIFQPYNGGHTYSYRVILFMMLKKGTKCNIKQAHDLQIVEWDTRAVAGEDIWL